MIDTVDIKIHEMVESFEQPVFICESSSRVICLNKAAKLLTSKSQNSKESVGISLVDTLSEGNSHFRKWFELNLVQTGAQKCRLNINNIDGSQSYFCFFNAIREQETGHIYAVFVRLERQQSLMGSRLYELQQYLSSFQESLSQAYISAHTDTLTGLYNRQHFDQVVKRHFDTLKLLNANCCIALIDIDDFKKINDSHGHSIGDSVLRDVAQLIRENCRETDIPTRWGGEEFVLFMANTDITKAEIIMERIRLRIQKMNVVCDQGTLSVTISAGLCSQSHSLVETMSNCDSLLYKAKELGKNRIVVEKHGR